MIRYPPTATTDTERRLMNSSIDAMKMPISRWKLFLEVLKAALEQRNFSVSSASFANAFAVRMPERLDSTSALMCPTRCLTLREAAPICRLRASTVTRNTGSRMHTTSASRHSVRNMMIKAPTIVTNEMKRSSGPWWASSVISNRSLVRRLMS